MKNIQKLAYKLTCCITVISMLIILQTSDIVFAKNSEMSEKQFSFWVISDLHSGSWDGYFQQPKIRAALTDIKETDPDTSAIITNGDNVESNTDGCWEQLVKAINDTIGKSIPMYFTIGNHELKVEEGGTYSEELERYFKYTNSLSADDTIDSVFYAHKINGQYFIHLGSQSQEENGHADLHQDQLDWLKGALKRADREGVRAYVFIHQPLKNTVSGTHGEVAGYDVIVQDSELREILDAHPNVLVFSGDSHIHLEYPNQALLGGKEKPSYFNDAAIGKMSGIENGAWTDYEGSQGLCVEVYAPKADGNDWIFEAIDSATGNEYGLNEKIFNGGYLMSYGEVIKRTRTGIIVNNHVPNEDEKLAGETFPMDKWNRTIPLNITDKVIVYDKTSDRIEIDTAACIMPGDHVFTKRMGTDYRGVFVYR